VRYKLQHRNRFKQTPRLPSWPDRVLYRSMDGSSISALTYAAITHPSLRVSDHQPVVATFDVEVQLSSSPENVECLPGLSESLPLTQGGDERADGCFGRGWRVLRARVRVSHHLLLPQLGSNSARAAAATRSEIALRVLEEDMAVVDDERD